MYSDADYCNWHYGGLTKSPSYACNHKEVRHLLIKPLTVRRTHLVGIYKFLLFAYTFIGFLSTSMLTLCLPVFIACFRKKPF